MESKSPEELFTLVNGSPFPRVFDDYVRMGSGKFANIDAYITATLRREYPELALTVAPAQRSHLLFFANAGFASAELDTTTDSLSRWRIFVPASRRGQTGFLGDAIFFAKYHYKWNNEHYIVYTVMEGLVGLINYILKEPAEGESTMSNTASTDALLKAVGDWQFPADAPGIYVYDRYWTKSRELYDQVQKAEWDNVILDPNKKKALTEVASKFFDSKDVYKDIGVPWKRGLIFHGPAGNGKTISIKALMHTLAERDRPIPTLYVKSAPYTFDIKNIFALARIQAPCLLVLEDIDTIVNKQTRSYFFNEVDGLQNNDGIMMVASTNHLDEIDAGLSKRPSRFDRKFLFPLPSLDERTQYSNFWRNKLENNPGIEFPAILSPAIAKITDGFSFAYMQEAFVAALVVIAGKRANEDGSDERSVVDLDAGDDAGDHEDDDLDLYELWREIKKQIKLLREDMDSSNPSISTSDHEDLMLPEPDTQIHNTSSVRQPRENMHWSFDTVRQPKNNAERLNFVPENVPDGEVVNVDFLSGISYQEHFY